LQGGFYSAQDADSEGEEGKFFVWTPQEIREVLGEEDSRIFGDFFSVTEGGNFEGNSILNRRPNEGQFAEQHDISSEELITLLTRSKQKLLAVREQRIHPLRDDKVLAGWNGLMLRSFAEAGAALGRQDYLDAASNNASFLLDEMRLEGRLLRTWREGQAKLLGYLEDYSCVADGLLALHEATLEPHWLFEAITLADQMIDLFWDEGVGGFYDTGKDHETLVIRPRDIFDNAQPSGSSVASDVLLKLSVITGNDDYASKAASPLRSLIQIMGRAPGGTGHWLAVLDFYVSMPKEIAIIGPKDDPATKNLLNTVFQRYLPNKVVVGLESPLPPLEKESEKGISPLLEGRDLMDGKPTAYVCQNYACQLPVTEPEDLVRQLEV